MTEYGKPAVIIIAGETIASATCSEELDKFIDETVSYTNAELQKTVVEHPLNGMSGTRMMTQYIKSLAIADVEAATWNIGMSPMERQAVRLAVTDGLTGEGEVLKARARALLLNKGTRGWVRGGEPFTAYDYGWTIERIPKTFWRAPYRRRELEYVLRDRELFNVLGTYKGIFTEAELKKSNGLRELLNLVDGLLADYETVAKGCKEGELKTAEGETANLAQTIDVLDTANEWDSRPLRRNLDKESAAYILALNLYAVEKKNPEANLDTETAEVVSDYLNRASIRVAARENISRNAGEYMTDEERAWWYPNVRHDTEARAKRSEALKANLRKSKPLQPTKNPGDAWQVLTKLAHDGYNVQGIIDTARAAAAVRYKSQPKPKYSQQGVSKLSTQLFDGEGRTAYRLAVHGGVKSEVYTLAYLTEYDEAGNALAQGAPGVKLSRPLTHVEQGALNAAHSFTLAGHVEFTPRDVAKLRYGVKNPTAAQVETMDKALARLRMVNIECDYTAHAAAAGASLDGDTVTEAKLNTYLLPAEVVSIRTAHGNVAKGYKVISMPPLAQHDADVKQRVSLPVGQLEAISSAMGRMTDRNAALRDWLIKRVKMARDTDPDGSNRKINYSDTTARLNDDDPAPKTLEKRKTSDKKAIRAALDEMTTLGIISGWREYKKPGERHAAGAMVEFPNDEKLRERLKRRRK